MRRIGIAVLAALPICLVLGSMQAASARHVHRHGKRSLHVYEHVYTRRVPIVTGSAVDVGLGFVGTGIASPESAIPTRYPPGYGFYGPGYGFYGPGFGHPGY